MGLKPAMPLPLSVLSTPLSMSFLQDSARYRMSFHTGLDGTAQLRRRARSDWRTKMRGWPVMAPGGGSMGGGLTKPVEVLVVPPEDPVPLLVVPSTVKLLDAVYEPPAVVIFTGPVAAPEGTVALTPQSETTVMFVARTPLK